MVEGVRLESVCAQKVPRVQIPLSPLIKTLCVFIYIARFRDLKRSTAVQLQGESLA